MLQHTARWSRSGLAASDGLEQTSDASLCRLASPKDGLALLASTQVIFGPAPILLKGCSRLLQGDRADSQHVLC